MTGGIMELKVKKLRGDANIPTTQYGDAGYDLYAVEDVFLVHGKTTVVKTGIALQCPENMYAQIQDRSSMAVKSIRVLGGVVDEIYRGEIKVVLHNLGNRGEYNTEHEAFGYSIKRGDRIAQFVLLEYKKPRVLEVQELTTTGRGINGFGSTGT